jgi:hypothetical protein
MLLCGNDQKLHRFFAQRFSKTATVLWDMATRFAEGEFE